MREEVISLIKPTTYVAAIAGAAALILITFVLLARLIFGLNSLDGLAFVDRPPELTLGDISDKFFATSSRKYQIDSAQVAGISISGDQPAPLITTGEPTVFSNSAVLSYIDLQRAKAGVPALTEAAYLSTEAKDHLLSVAGACFNLTNSIPVKSGDTLAGATVFAVAENHATHATTIAGAQQSIELDSASLANMVNSKFTHYGAAAVVAEDANCLGRVYVVHYFTEVR